MAGQGYSPRHLAGPNGEALLSAAARARVDAERVERAIVVLAATDNSLASRILYRELLLSGALHGALVEARSPMVRMPVSLLERDRVACAAARWPEQHRDDCRWCAYLAGRRLGVAS